MLLSTLMTIRIQIKECSFVLISTSEYSHVIRSLMRYEISTDKHLFVAIYGSHAEEKNSIEEEC